MTYSQSFALTAQTGPSAPPQAVNAGYKTSAFNADFLSPSEVGTQAGVPAKFYAVHLNDSTAVPSSYYSVANSILTMTTGVDGDGNGITTVNYGINPALSSPGNIKADSGGGIAFQYGYIEASIAYDGYVSEAQWWPSFWSWTIENSWNSPSYNSNMYVGEIDFLEVACNYDSSTNMYTGKGTPYASLHEWTGSNGQRFSPTTDTTPSSAGMTFNKTTFNKYGCLWTPTSLTFYYNDVAGNTISTVNAVPVSYASNDGSYTGPANNTFTSLNQQHSYLTIGTGTDGKWPIYVDWVRVWQ